MKLDSTLSAVVTGGASGLGLATVKALRAQGVKVAIFDLNQEIGEKMAKETGAVFCQCDVLSDESVDQAFASAREVNGQERILVCCAGGGNAIPTVRRDKKTGEIQMFPTDKFEWVLRLNTVGTFRCITRSAAGMMAEDLLDEERGVIVNTASAAATDGQMGQAAYSAAKAGIVGMTLTIARDLSREAIRVNTIQPGIFDTPAMARAPQAMKDALGAMVPHPRRLGHPDEFASLVLEMVRNRYMNAETIRLDGAIRMQPR
ncbi:SDR family oxidoreductase [Ketobacter sp. MCCC 1A13808]|uniref:SDR family NAD(P)-dependent oxidoreductase n=1 Tax=Ketobacter sp. MCCC 1A13808 TaxID=2602738 RepID=UPI000F2D7408|nr:SDR family NAD(P)-dependent oxidoreductase [Ketobacter sp. MCCC 1A13808]MVF13465.1 SDR family oxidoreductase [Ketobacter sp. MCCC 1A13808]RLP52980.1 MAG: SDR family oxidoreductase [Ketobacter sp.]